MKKYIFINAFQKITKITLIFIIGSLVVLSSCREDIVNYRTETKEMLGDYLVRFKKDSSQFIEFNRLLDTTKVMGLLKAYGEYTCFAPTDAAFKAFYESQGRKSMKDFSLDTLKQIAYNQIIKGQIITTDLFKTGRLASLSMNDRYVTVDSIIPVGSSLIYKINKTSTILKKDQLVNNGVIHTINEVLNPTQFTSIAAIALDKRFKLFYEALQKTHLADSLLKTKDDSYNWENFKSMLSPPFTQGGGSVDQLPLSRKYGFTLLMESDITFKDIYHIENIGQLQAKAKELYDPIYPEDANVIDITDRRNSLNRFVAYHMINKQLSYSKFINDYDTQHMIKTYDMYEYIETMCPNTLLEVRKVRTQSPDANYINMCSKPGETPDFTRAIQILSNNKDNDATNGVYHEIDKILAYDATVSSYMGAVRLRLDAASFFPELTNNNMRGFLGDKAADIKSWIFPKGYIDRLKTAEGTVFTYLNSFGGYLDYEGDEVYLRGQYDFSVVTPPIPAGTYEVRFGYQPTGGRGVAQLSFDGTPCGIPLDLRVNASSPLIGYVVPSDASIEDPSGYENDKMMRNRGYMKGPSSYKSYNGVFYGITVARQSDRVLRRILGIYQFDKPGTHVFSVKSVMVGQFMFDYLEFVPTSIIGTEGVD